MHPSTACIDKIEKVIIIHVNDVNAHLNNRSLCPLQVHIIKDKKTLVNYADDANAHLITVHDAPSDFNSWKTVMTFITTGAFSQGC